MFARSHSLTRKPGYPTFPTTLQFGIEVSDPKLIPEFIDRIEKSLITCYYSLDGGYAAKLPRPVDAIKMPPTKNVQEACDWVGNNYLPYSKTSTTIAANDHHIALSVCHVISDGGLFTRLLTKIQNQNVTKINTDHFPMMMQQTFEDEIKMLDPNFKYFNIEQLTRYKSDKNLLKDDCSRYSRANTFKESIENLIIYDPKTKRLRGMTEHMWTGLTLSICALKNKLGPIGCATCVDLRDSKHDSPEMASEFSILWPCAPVSPYQTVGELGNLLRNDFNLKRGRGDAFATWTGIDKGFNAPHDDAVAEISLLNPVHYKKPITDAWIQILQGDDYRSRSISLLGQSYVNDDTGSNVFIGRLRSPQSQVNDLDALKISEGLHHFLLSIPKSCSVIDAFQELKIFQSKL